EDRELRFTVPEVPNSRLTLQAPAAATHLQALVWRGAQRVVNGAQLEVDLGRVGAAHVRWRLESRTARPAVARVREAYLWDLTDSAARLYGMVRFMVAPASVTALAVDVPKGLEVAAVAVRPLDDPSRTSPAAP